MSFSNVFNRAKNLLISPQMEWVRIESESTSRKELIKGYVVPFVILIAICSFIGASVFSLQLYTFWLIIIKILITAALIIAGVLLSSLIINELCPSFETPKNPDATLKLIVYSFTSFYISSCLVGLLPDLTILAVLGFHSVYLFWMGTSAILKTPEVNKPGFVIVSFLIMIGIYAILSLFIRTIVLGMLFITQPQ
jgi:hypothetical protein